MYSKPRAKIKKTMLVLAFVNLAHCLHSTTYTTKA